MANLWQQVEAWYRAMTGCALPQLSPLAPSLGQLYEQVLCQDPQAKKIGGAYYTPPHLVDVIVQKTLGQAEDLPTVLDPACGGGFFLVAAYQALLEGRSRYLKRTLTFAERQHILLTCIHGVDIDPQAVTVTKFSLLLKLLEGQSEDHPLPDLSSNIQWGNAVIDSEFDWHQAFPHILQEGFNIIMGNPPYVDSEWMTLHLPEWRRYCTQHYKSATGNWDLFCVFIEKALILCRSGGVVGLVVPNKLASAEYAAAARSLLTTEGKILFLQDYSQDNAFDAAIYPLIFVAQKGQGEIQSRGKTWATTATDQQSRLLERLNDTFPPLAAIAQVHGAATVAEAYEIQDMIQDREEFNQPDQPDQYPMVNSGTIDRYCFLWGKKPMRYLGQSYQYPVVRGDRLPTKRLQQTRTPKIIISGMTRRLECALDQEGAILAGKSTAIIFPFQNSEQTVDLFFLLGVLNSRLISFYFAHYFGGNGLKGGYLRVGAPQLRQLPICAFSPDLVDLVKARLQRNNLPQSQPLDDRIDHWVYQLYGLTDSEIQTVTCTGLGE